MSEPELQDEGPSLQADLLAALAVIGFGLIVTIGAWKMERLENLGATLYTAPGLVPGILGVSIAFLGLLLALRSLRRRARVRAQFPDRPELVSLLPSARPSRVAWQRMGLVLLLMLGYAVGLVGHGIAFWFATALFVFAFIAIFEWPERHAKGDIARGIASALIFAIATTAVVTLVFEQVFFVRLP